MGHKIVNESYQNIKKCISKFGFIFPTGLGNEEYLLTPIEITLRQMKIQII